MTELVPVRFMAVIESIFISKTIILRLLFAVSERVKNISGEDWRGCGVLSTVSHY